MRIISHPFPTPNHPPNHPPNRPPNHPTCGITVTVYSTRYDSDFRYIDENGSVLEEQSLLTPPPTTRRDKAPPRRYPTQRATAPTQGGGLGAREDSSPRSVLRFVARERELLRRAAVFTKLQREQLLQRQAQVRADKEAWRSQMGRAGSGSSGQGGVVGTRVLKVRGCMPGRGWRCP
jgi:hypothetical protein